MKKNCTTEKMKKGFILCDGTIFHHSNAEVKLTVRRSDGGLPICLYIKKGRDFPIVYRYLKKNKYQFDIGYTLSGRQEGKGYFEIHFQLFHYAPKSASFSKFEEFAKNIKEIPSKSRFFESHGWRD